MQERSSSIRLRRRRGEEGRQEFLKSRRSGEWSHRVEESGADTLDPGVGGGLVQNRLRPLLRQQWGEANAIRGSREVARYTSGREGETWVDGPALDDSWETQTKASRRTARSERASRSRDVAGDSPGAKFSFNCFSSGGVVAEVDETILPVRGGGMLTEGGAGEAALLRGVVWVQRERLFARWKERFCILTRDYLHCFKKGSTQLTECGPFLFKVRLSSVGCVKLVDRRGYLTVVLPREGQDSLLLRRPEGVREWHTAIQVGCKEAKGRLMQSAEQFWAGRETDQMEEWLLARARVGEKYHYTGPREEPRPSSAASVDRRRQRRRAASEYSEAGTSLPRVGRRSASADRARRSRNPESQFSKQQQQQHSEQGNVGSEDSGVSSLNNSTAGSRTSGRPGRPQYRSQQ